MSGTCQATYIVDEKTALYWWRALPGNYFVYRLSKEGELQNPEKIENYNPQYGVEWKVGVENDLEDTVLISSWQPKKHPSSIWRVDIH